MTPKCLFNSDVKTETLMSLNSSQADDVYLLLKLVNPTSHSGSSTRPSGDIIIPRAALIGKKSHRNGQHWNSSQQNAFQTKKINKVGKMKSHGSNVFMRFWRMARKVPPATVSRFPPNLLPTTQHVGQLVSTHHNVFRVSTWDSSPTCKDVRVSRGPWKQTPASTHWKTSLFPPASRQHLH